MSVVKVPITNDPNQSFSISVPAGEENRVLDMFAYFNTISSFWELRISDGATGDELINGLPLLYGIPPADNLLEAFEYQDIGQAYIVKISEDAPENPTTDSWDKDFELYWGVLE